MLRHAFGDRVLFSLLEHSRRPAGADLSRRSLSGRKHPPPSGSWAKSGALRWTIKAMPADILELIQCPFQPGGRGIPVYQRLGYARWSVKRKTAPPCPFVRSIHR